MSVFKQFLSQDIIITPFQVNKNFTFIGASALTSSDVGIDRFTGTNISGLFNPNSDPLTGQFYTGSYQRLVYNSIKELYYSNFISSSRGDEATISQVNNGVIIISNDQQPRYENYLQSTLVPQRYFPTASGDKIGVISIPSTLFGEKIKAKSFVLSTPSGSIIDDGEGNIFYTTSSYVDPNYIDDYYFNLGYTQIGNIIYSHGIIIITQALITSPNSGSLYGIAMYSSSLYGGINFAINNIDEYINAPYVTMSFSSTYTILESQYKCTIRESEFNFSLNPSLLTGSIKDTVKDFVTGSYFNPYITTVGLYNENQELLAIAKMSQPLPTSRTVDMSININLDR